MEHADAITIHKSQGSEYNDIYIMLPDKPVSLLTRNMVNTAISRARKSVVLIVVNDALQTAASNRFKRNRITRLKEKLKNMGEIICPEEEKKQKVINPLLEHIADYSDWSCVRERRGSYCISCAGKD